MAKVTRIALPPILVSGNSRVFYQNINSVFLKEDGTLTREIMPDLLHPNAHGYELWAEAIALWWPS